MEPERFPRSPPAHLTVEVGFTPPQASAASPETDHPTPIAMGALGGEPERARGGSTNEATQRHIARALGVLTMTVLIYFTLAVGVKLPTDGSLAVSITVACLPLRWNGVAEAYESVGERAGALVNQIGPTLNRQAGSAVLLILVLWFTRRAMGYATEVTASRVKPNDERSAIPCYVTGTPRMDLLSHDEAKQLHIELLAGNEVPDWIPPSISHALCIVDTGCGRSMGNHPDQFAPGTIRAQESAIAGAAGSFTTKECGDLRLPVETVAHGVRAFTEKNAISSIQLAPMCCSRLGGRQSRWVLP